MTTTFCVAGPIDGRAVDFARKALAGGHEIALHGLRHLNADACMAETGAEQYWRNEIEPQLTGCAVRPESAPHQNTVPEAHLLTALTRRRL